MVLRLRVSSTNLQRNPESSALLNKNLYKTAQKELFVNKQDQMTAYELREM
jgi:hypothetical protein